MPSDDEEIRELVATWMSATRAGDIDAVLELSSARPTGIEFDSAFAPFPR